MVVYWTHDMFAAAWGSVLIVDGKVYTGDEDGDIVVFALSSDPNTAMKQMKDKAGKTVMDGGKPQLFPINARLSADGNAVEIPNMINAIYSTPIVANNTLFISNKCTVFALKQGAKLKGGVKQGSQSGKGVRTL